MSSSRAVHAALSLEHLTQAGLVSLFNIWQTPTAKDLNRLVRTRMPGGVGRAVRNGRPYPISPSFAMHYSVTP